MEQKGGAVAELGDGSLGAPVPDEGGELVVAGLEKRGEVDGLVAPVREVGALWAVGDGAAVDEEPVAVVGGVVGGVSPSLEPALRLGWEARGAPARFVQSTRPLTGS